MDLKKKFALTIRQLRLQNPDLKMKQSEIADEVGISTKYYYELESGKKMPTLGIVELIAKAFGLTLSEFCKLVEDQN